MKPGLAGARLAGARLAAMAMLGLVALSSAGCASTLQNIYDNAAHDECRTSSNPRACNDSVDENSRRHDD